VAATVITTLLLIPVARATFRVNQAEGNFRYLHARLREFAESISFIGGQSAEQKKSSVVFDVYYTESRSLFKRWFVLSTFSTFQMAVTSSVACFLLVLAIQSSDNNTLDGSSLTVTNVTSGIQAIVGFLASLAAIPSLYSSAGNVAGFAHRVGQLLETLDSLFAAEATISERCAPAPSLELSARDLSVVTPGGRTLLAHASFEVTHGHSVMIMGPSGAGKSSLLRVLGGLWPFEEGSIARPTVIGANGVFFVPQRPYITLGSLMEQVIYPHVRSECIVPEADLVALLASLNLSYLTAGEGGLHAVRRWDAQLSAGEQQRLGIARLLYHKPRFALCDEATSAGRPHGGARHAHVPRREHHAHLRRAPSHAAAVPRARAAAGRPWRPPRALNRGGGGRVPRARDGGDGGGARG
jgi:ABC-type uncharacterized transport system fused permease/ATPase subunit